MKPTKSSTNSPLGALLHFEATLDRRRQFSLTFGAMKRIEAQTGFDFARLIKDPGCMPPEHEFVVTLLTEMAREEDPSVLASTIRSHLTFEKIVGEIGPSLQRAIAAASAFRAKRRPFDSN